MAALEASPDKRTMRPTGVAFHDAHDEQDPALKAAVLEAENDAMPSSPRPEYTDHSLRSLTTVRGLSGIRGFSADGVCAEVSSGNYHDGGQEADSPATTSELKSVQAYESLPDSPAAVPDEVQAGERVTAPSTTSTGAAVVPGATGGDMDAVAVASPPAAEPQPAAVVVHAAGTSVPAAGPGTMAATASSAASLAGLLSAAAAQLENETLVNLKIGKVCHDIGTTPGVPPAFNDWFQRTAVTLLQQGRHTDAIELSIRAHAAVQSHLRNVALAAAQLQPSTANAGTTSPASTSEQPPAVPEMPHHTTAAGRKRARSQQMAPGGANVMAAAPEVAVVGDVVLAEPAAKRPRMGTVASVAAQPSSFAVPQAPVQRLDHQAPQSVQQLPELYNSVPHCQQPQWPQPHQHKHQHQPQRPSQQAPYGYTANYAGGCGAYPGGYGAYPGGYSAYPHGANPHPPPSVYPAVPQWRPTPIAVPSQQPSQPGHGATLADMLWHYFFLWVGA